MEGDEARSPIKTKASDFILAKKLLERMKYTFDMFER